MATRVLGTQISEEVRQRAQLPDYTATTFITLTDIRTLVNDSAADLCGVIRAHDGENRFTTRTVVTTSAGVASCSLANLSSPFFALRHLHWQVGSNEIIDLERLGSDDWEDPALGTSWTNSAAPQYQIFGDELWFWPTPQDSYNLVVYYDTGISFGSDLSGTCSLEAGWKEWIVCDVLRKIRAREGRHELSMNHLNERNAVAETLIKRNGRRDGWAPQTVRDVSTAGRGRPLKRRYW